MDLEHTVDGKRHELPEPFVQIETEKAKTTTVEHKLQA